MSKSPRTNRSTPKLSEVARDVCVPTGIVSSAFPAVKKQLAKLNVSFDRWQEGMGSLILSKRSDGSYSASIGGVVLSIPRQTGKTYTVGWIVFALCIMCPGLTVIWTAHRVKTSTETFQQMRTMARNPKVAPLMDAVRSGSGDQVLMFRNGSRILFGAREKGFGRGFAKVDILVLDEGQILTEDAMSDMVPATNAAPNGLVLMMGTPPRPKDPGEVFANRRSDALGGDPDTLYIGFSADPDTDVDSWKPGYVSWNAIAEANPSYPHRTNKTAILRMRKLLVSNESFKREALGIWDKEGGGRLISKQQWEATASAPPASGIKSFAVAFSADGTRQSVAGAVKHADGVHVNLIGMYSGSTEAGVAAVADWLVERKATTAEVAVAGAAGRPLVDSLIQRKFPAKYVRYMSSTDVVTANAMMLDAFREETVTHPIAPPEDALEQSVAVSDRTDPTKRQDGSWRWEATTPDGDETPMEAISFAHWVARTTKRHPGRKQVALA